MFYNHPGFFKEAHMSQTQSDGYLARPSTGTGRPVLVLHPWWGLNNTIKAFCDRLAEAGFVAFAPDLYHGKVVNTIPEAEAMAQGLYQNYNQAVAEIAEATRILSERTNQAEVPVIGFSMGANYALDLAIADPEHIRSVVLFYGTGGGDFSLSKAAFLGHFAEADEFEPLESVKELEEALKEAGRPVTFYTYPDTGHWFFESDRVDVYNAAAANLAWDRTIAFLTR
jgi:carboxymethylenebutenolidase